MRASAFDASYLLGVPSWRGSRPAQPFVFVALPAPYAMRSD
jgi:hypothetical protein